MDISFETLNQIIESMAEGVYFTDLNRTITYWNKGAEKISGYKSDEVLGSKCSNNILIHIDKCGTSLCNGNCPLSKTMDDNKPRESNVYLHHKDGHRIPVAVRINTIKNSNGETIGGFEIFSDLSSDEAQKKRISELKRLALLDNLTQLVNRHYLNSDLKKRIDSFNCLNIPFGIIFIDIDHFKRFNDTWGHSIGDEILKLIARNLKKSGRSLDIFGRWGGEEFLGIIPSIESKDLKNLAERIRIIVENSFIIHKDEKLSATISLGATVVRKGDSIESVINRADKLLYKSKQNGRNRVSIDI